jgi:hypothetical protein
VDETEGTKERFQPGYLTEGKTPMALTPEEKAARKHKAKRRKRTNKKVPAKGRLKDMADDLWSLAVKADWGNRCAICGRRTSLNSHHLVPRANNATRFNLRNGICLCKTCHQFCPKRSPHQNAKGFVAWLELLHRCVAEWYEENTPPPAFDGITNPLYYIDQIQRLREYVDPDDFERIVGVKFCAYLDGAD